MNEQESVLKQLEYLKAIDAYLEEKLASKLKDVPADPYESEDTKEVNTALAKAQGEFPQIGLNRENPYFKSKFADLNSIVMAVKPYLAKNGLSVTQQVILTKDGMTILVTKLRHISGQWISTKARILPVKNDPQSYASYLTYMKRYSFISLLNITTSDDTTDDDAERNMYDVRDAKSKGVALNNKYNPKDQNGETITPEQLSEIEYELAAYDDIADMVLDGLKIQSLADMPKNKYAASIQRIREIKRAREGLD